MVEIATAGTTIRIELMKKGLQTCRLHADLRRDQACKPRLDRPHLRQVQHAALADFVQGFSEFTTIT
jgi:hypothetical protein